MLRCPACCAALPTGHTYARQVMRELGRPASAASAARRSHSNPPVPPNPSPNRSRNSNPNPNPYPNPNPNHNHNPNPNPRSAHLSQLIASMSTLLARDLRLGSEG